ncbi:hypothetical protein GCM10009547_26140 [Sporichthya brevicatena]|uniref:Uncharacterized protein n=1 Tax=Sporichthya brevicatena TaxID=171442 RepID=A0ABN1GWU0_9ACTN
MAEHDQGAGVAAEDAFEALAQLRPRSDRGQRGAQKRLVFGSRSIGTLDRGHTPPPGLRGCSRPSECKRRDLRIRRTWQLNATGSSPTLCVNHNGFWCF